MSDSCLLDLIPHRTPSVELVRHAGSCSFRKQQKEILACETAAARIWAQVDGEKSIRDIVNADTKAERSYDPPDFHADLVALLQHLAEAQVICLSQFAFSVVMVAVGNKFNAWALAAVDSLRRNGQYDGLVFILTDQPGVFARCERLLPLVVPGSLSAIQAKTYKTRLLDRIAGENLLYIDADIVCGGSLLILQDSLRKHCSAKPMAVFTDTGSAGDPYHSGVFLIRRDGNHILRRWRKCIQDMDDNRDQSALARTLSTDEVALIDKRFLSFPDAAFVHRGAVRTFVHFTFSHRQLKLDRASIRRYLVEVLGIEHIPANLLPDCVSGYGDRVSRNNLSWHTNDKYLYYDGQNKLANKQVAAGAGCKVPRVYAVLATAEELDFDKLPACFAIKPSHLAGGKCVYLVRDGINIKNGRKIDPDEIRSNLAASLKAQQSGRHRDYVASHMRPEIIVEQLLLDDNGRRLPEYEFMVFHGEMLFVQKISHNPDGTSTIEYFNRDKELIGFDGIHSGGAVHAGTGAAHHPRFTEAVRRAERLAAESGMAALRVDLKLRRDGVYFGEFTLNPGGGRIFTPWMDLYMGLLWDHPEITAKEKFSPTLYNTGNKWRRLNRLLDEVEQRERHRQRLRAFFTD